jgi:transcriptional regulator GlxA family with amidase domain
LFFDRKIIANSVRHSQISIFKKFNQRGQEGTMEWTIVLPNFKNTNPIIKKINDYVLANLSAETTLKDMAKVSGVSTFYLCRLFKKELQITPIKWLWTQRVMAAAAYLTTKQKFSLTDVAFSCGFTSSAHFSRLFKTTYGVNPREFRKLMAEENKVPHDIEVIPIIYKNSKKKFSMINYSLY